MKFRKFSIGDVVYTRDGFSNIITNNIFNEHNSVDNYGGHGYKEGLKLVVKSSTYNEIYTNAYRFESVDYAIYEKALMSEGEYLSMNRDEKLEELLG
jgi:hypothetical protein